MIDIPDEKLLKGYWYILENPTGYVSDLADIHPDLNDHFATTNIICSIGIDSLSRPRYHLTDLGRELAKEAYLALASNLANEDVDSLFNG
jgi:hypothetical protein